jgi:hypothetical protein
MKQVLFLSLVVLMGATTLFVDTFFHTASAEESQNSISGICCKDFPSTETLSGLVVTCVGGGNTYYYTSESNGYYTFGNLQADVAYTITAKSIDFEANGGWKGAITQQTPSCENPPCNFSFTRNISCGYYESPQ